MTPSQEEENKQQDVQWSRWFCQINWNRIWANLDLHFKVNDLRDDGLMFGGLSLQVSHESLVIVALLRQLIKLVLSHVERPL